MNKEHKRLKDAWESRPKLVKLECDVCGYTIECLESEVWQKRCPTCAEIDTWQRKESDG